MFTPTTTQELRSLGVTKLDIILVSGDSYIDSPFIGVSVIAKVLTAAGYKVGIIAQPDVDSDRDISRLGEPALFWGVTGGSVDSMVANYTALKKKRQTDDYTPGGINNRRPDRAAIVYTNLIRRYFKNTRPIVLGGIEASLRRIAHYDFWSNSVRRSILFDAKADVLVYGMAENTIVSLAGAISKGHDYRDLAGICYSAKEARPDYIKLADFAVVSKDKQSFIDMFHTFYHNNDPLTAKGLVQKQDSRFLVQNPPAPYLSQSELDRIYELDYSHDLHPFYKKEGKVRALDTIRFSITSHRGCYGECSFCAIAVHQGRTVQSRSEQSIIQEAKVLASHPDFKGYILDVGGPTANMYGFECTKKIQHGICENKRCLFPKICAKLPISHQPQINLLQKLKKLPKVKKVFVASGLRHDMIMADHGCGRRYLQMLVEDHVSGQLKIAPEHCEKHVLNKMGKPDMESTLAFKNLFDQYTKKADKKQYLTYYFIAAHPGCRTEDMKQLKEFCRKKLHLTPEQTQIFTPTPSTYSSLMYYTGLDPFTGQPLFVEKDKRGKERQKQILVSSTGVRGKSSGKTKTKRK